MTSTNWKQIEELLQAALEIQPSEREAWLESHCEGDEALRAEVVSLLAVEAECASFLDQPVVAKAARLLTANDEGPTRIGQQIGPYQILNEIGHGGMGVVFLAEREDQFHQQVAIKLVKRGLDTEDIVRRFRNERQILASLNHPNIAKLFDGGMTADGLPYFVMEYIEGLPLLQYCDDHNVSTNERLRLFRRVCAAVQHAHQNLIIHRDLKPSNILTTSEGEVKLLDFGVAKLLSSGSPEGALTQTQAALRVMTPEYASPEQVRGQHVTTATDVYSLGVVLYELLTGAKPYKLKDTSPGELSRAICDSEPSKPSEAVRITAFGVPTSVGRYGTASGSDRPPVSANFFDKARAGRYRSWSRNDKSPTKVGSLNARNPKSLRGDLDNIILMALRKDPARRYKSVEQFSEDIKRHLEGLPVSARKDTFSYRTSKFVQRHKVGVAAAALVVISLVSGVVMAMRQERKAQRRFNDVRQLANSIIFEIHDSIENLPGSTPARELLVKRALEYLDNLAREAGDDPSLQRELVAGYLKVGNVQGNPNNANLGDSAGAMRSYRKAQMIAERLTASDPKDARAERLLAVIHEKIGDLENGSGNVAAAVKSVATSLALFRELAAAHPTDAKAQESLAISHVKVGDFLGNSNFPNVGDLSGALKSYQSSSAILQSLYAADKNDFKTRRLLGLIYERIGGILESQGKVADALENYRLSLAIREPLAAENSTNTETVRDVAIAHEKIGNVMTTTGDLKAALESRTRSLSLFKDLAKADPQNEQARRSLAISFDYMGDILGYPDAPNLGKREEALKSYQQALELLQSKAGDTANAETSRFLAHTQERVGALLAAEGKTTDAIASYQRSLKLLEAMTEDQQANPGTRHDLGTLYAKFGETYETLAMKAAPISEKPALLSEACSWYEKGAELFVELRNHNMLVPPEAAQPDKLLAKAQECNKTLDLVKSQSSK